MAETSNISLVSHIGSNENPVENNEEFDLSKAEETSLESTQIASQVETMMSLKSSLSAVAEEGQSLETSQADQSDSANVSESEEKVLVIFSKKRFNHKVKVESDSLNEEHAAEDEANITKETVDGITTYTINDSMGRREISVALNQLEPNANNTQQISQRVRHLKMTQTYSLGFCETYWRTGHFDSILLGLEHSETVNGTTTCSRKSCPRKSCPRKPCPRNTLN